MWEDAHILPCSKITNAFYFVKNNIISNDCIKITHIIHILRVVRSKHLYLKCTYFCWNQNSVLKLLLDYLWNGKMNKASGYNTIHHLLQKPLRVYKFSLRPSQTSQRRATDMNPLTWRHCYHFGAFPPLSGNSAAREKVKNRLCSSGTSCKYTERWRARQIRCTSHTWPRLVSN